MCDNIKKLNFVERFLSVFGVEGKVVRLVDIKNICAKLNNDIATHAKNIISQKELIISKTAEVVDLKATIAELNSDKVDLSKSVEDLKNKSNSMESKNNKANVALKKVKAELKNLKDNEESYCAELSDLKKKFNSLKKENVANIKELELAAKQLGDLGTTKPAKGKLTCEDIRAAKKSLDAGDKLEDVAKALGVNKSTISKAVRGVTYKHCKDSGL